jgi:hypothetical protein
LKDAERQVQMVHESLKVAQSRQKSYADKRRRDLSFEIRDFIYFKVSPMRGTHRLRALLEHLGITTAPWYRIKEVPHSGRVEFKAIAEIFFVSRVLYRHKGPAFRTSRSDAVANAAWQAITSWVRSNKSRLQNSVHYLLPYRKKDQFKAYGVERDIPRMEMVHHQDVAVELSTCLLTA